MKKQFIVLAFTVCLLTSAVSVGAQTRKVSAPWGISVRGGVIGNVHENVMSYFRHRRFSDLFTAGFSVDGMYDFTNLFGVRLSVAAGKNAGACNSQEAGGGFYPYQFRSINAFADAMIHFGTPEDAFSSRIYGGLGYARTYDLIEEMKDGVYEDGSKVLRAKIDMSSPNINMRDPIIYRVAHLTHHNTGDKWCIYPNIKMKKLLLYKKMV